MRKIFKHTRSGKPYAEKAPHIEGCVNTKIQDNYNPAPKNSPVDCADMLLPIAKTIQVKQ